MASGSKIEEVVLYDGDCAFCNQSVGFVLKHESSPKLMFCSLQSERGKALLTKFKYPLSYRDSVLLYADNRLYDKSEAAFRIANYMKFPLSLLKLFVVFPPFIFDPIYDLIAKYRFSILKNSISCSLPKSNNQSRFLE